MSSLRQAALRIARSRCGGTAAWLLLGPLRRVIRLRVLAEDEHAVAVHHPRPSYPIHLLIVPKRRVPDFLEADADVLTSVLALASQVSRSYFTEHGADVVTNLGRYQEVRLLHFHVIPAQERASGTVMPQAEPRESLQLAQTSARHALEDNGGCRVILVDHGRRVIVV